MSAVYKRKRCLIWFILFPCFWNQTHWLVVAILPDSTARGLPLTMSASILHVCDFSYSILTRNFNTDGVLYTHNAHYSLSTGKITSLSPVLAQVVLYARVTMRHQMIWVLFPVLSEYCIYPTPIADTHNTVKVVCVLSASARKLRV